MVARLGVTLVLALAAPVAAAQRQTPPPPNPLSLIRAFQCTFPRYVATEWPAGGSVTREGTDDNFTFRITEINLRRSVARIVGTGGSVPASAMVGETGLNVVEQTGLGNFILTSIFRAGADGQVYLAAHSRHLGDPKTPPSVSQHFGTCTPLEPEGAKPNGR
jgi:hypothetical protein